MVESVVKAVGSAAEAVESALVVAGGDTGVEIVALFIAALVEALSCMLEGRRWLGLSIPLIIVLGTSDRIAVSCADVT